jgi:hypothetical protein
MVKHYRKQLRLSSFSSLRRPLAPGDTSPASRWPADGQSGALFQSSLAAAVIAVPGVLSCTVNLPATSLTPIEKTIYTLSTLWVHA